MLGPLDLGEQQLGGMTQDRCSERANSADEGDLHVRADFNE